MQNNEQRTITIAANAECALNVLQVTMPFSYVIRVPAGSQLDRQLSNHPRPYGRWTDYAEDARIQASENYQDSETVPFHWMHLAAGAAAVEVDLVGIGVSRITAHHSDEDDLPAALQQALEVEAGESMELGTVAGLVNYPKGSLDVAIADADAAVATGTFTAGAGGGTLAINGIAAGGPENVTFTFSSPAGNQTTLTVAVTVT